MIVEKGICFQPLHETEFESLNGRHETVVYKFTLTNNISF